MIILLGKINTAVKCRCMCTSLSQEKHLPVMDVSGFLGLSLRMLWLSLQKMVPSHGTTATF